jgi:hypothetical protein
MEKLKELFSSVDPKILTEEVQKKLDGLFEAAVTAHVSTLKEEIQVTLEEETRKELTEFKENTINKLDEFLTLFTEEYLEDNAEEIESTLKTKILEDIVTGITKVFKEHNLVIPESEKEAVVSLEKKNKDLTENVNSLVKRNSSLTEEIERQIGLRVWNEETKDLALDKVEDLKKLMEDVEFADADSLREKITIMKESFLSGKSSKKLTEDREKAKDTFVADLAAKLI